MTVSRRPGQRTRTAARRGRTPLPPHRDFLARLAANGAIAAAMVAGSLAIGVVGYHVTAGLSWVDALLNAAMILTGMGPVDPLPTTTAKLFASAYALFSGVAFLTIVAVLLAPVVHRFLHRFHLDLDDARNDDAPDDDRD